MPLGKVRPESEGERHLALWLKRLRDPTFVYVVQSGAPIKVGFAKDVPARIALLQCGNPVELKLLYVVPADQALERAFHRKLKDSRIRGEWFAGPAIPAFLKYVEGLIRQMMETYDGWDVPDWRKLDPALVPKQRHGPVTVRFVKPNPKASPEEAERLRRWASGATPFEKYAPIHALGDRAEIIKRQRKS